MTRHIVLWPDTHHSDQHTKAVQNLVRYIGDSQPDEVCILGDFLDMKAPARWSKGRAEEYAAGSLKRELAAAYGTLALLRTRFDGRVTFIVGNHEARYENYLNAYAPAIAGISKTLPELLRLDDYGVTLMDQPYRIAPGVVAIHGDLLRANAGASALAEVGRHGMSVVQGHTHRLGLVYQTHGATRFALEAGHLSDIRKASYLSFPGVANWQNGFGSLRVSGNTVSPAIHKVSMQGAFTVDGETYV